MGFRLALLGLTAIGTASCAFSWSDDGDPGPDPGGPLHPLPPYVPPDFSSDSPCSPGLRLCGDACVDATSNPEHCGRCGEACGPDQVCNESTCATACGPGRTECDRACVDLRTADAHCGACGAACPVGESCTDGECGCIPLCTGRRCGPDGCGGSCGECTDGFSCDSEGVCGCAGTPCGTSCCGDGQSCVEGSCCDDAWVAEFPGTQLVDVSANSDGTWYVAGTVTGSLAPAEGDRPFVAQLDACGRELARQSLLPAAARRGRAAGIAELPDGRVYVAGLQGDVPAAGADGLGFITRLRPDNLSVLETTTFDGSPAVDGFEGFALAADGAQWAGGTAGLTGGPNDPTCAWLVRHATADNQCAWNLFPECGGEAIHDVAAVGRDWVMVTGRRNGGPFVARFVPGDCGVGPYCGCIPADVAEFTPSGADAAEAFLVGGYGSQAVVAGRATLPDGDVAAFVARVGFVVPVESMLLNPTPQVDSLFGGSMDGARLVAAGVSGWNPATGTSMGLVVRYDIAAGRLGAPTGTWFLPEAGACWDVAVDDAGGLTTVCSTTDPALTSTVRHCPPGGVCP